MQIAWAKLDQANAEDMEVNNWTNISLSGFETATRSPAPYLLDDCAHLLLMW